MAKAKKKAKDLEPKGRAKKVKGGGLQQDQKNINRSVGHIKKFADSTAVEPVQNSGKTIRRAVKNVT